MQQELLYADDAALVAHTEADLLGMCTAFGAAYNEFGMISFKKRVVMAQPALLAPSITIHDTSLSSVKQFTYLGSSATSSCSLYFKLDIRIRKAATILLTEFGGISIYHACTLSTL